MDLRHFPANYLEEGPERHTGCPAHPLVGCVPFLIGQVQVVLMIPWPPSFDDILITPPLFHCETLGTTELVFVRNECTFLVPLEVHLLDGVYQRDPAVQWLGVFPVGRCHLPCLSHTSAGCHSQLQREWLDKSAYV